MSWINDPEKLKILRGYAPPAKINPNQNLVSKADSGYRSAGVRFQYDQLMNPLQNIPWNLLVQGDLFTKQDFGISPRVDRPVYLRVEAKKKEVRSVTGRIPDWSMAVMLGDAKEFGWLGLQAQTNSEVVVFNFDGDFFVAPTVEVKNLVPVVIPANESQIVAYILLDDIFSGCPNGVRFVNLGQVLNCLAFLSHSKAGVAFVHKDSSVLEAKLSKLLEIILGG